MPSQELGKILNSPSVRYQMRSLHVRKPHQISRLLRSLERLSPCETIHEPIENRNSQGKESSLARLEVVLVLAREPLTSRKLAKLAHLADGTEANTLMRVLRDRYDRRGSAFQVATLAGGYQLLTRREFARWLRSISPENKEFHLSEPAMETLSVVAYRQPVLRAEVEAIRGVQCGELIRQLMDRQLLRIFGRSEELGRPFLYSTTKRFLELFGLKNLEELPMADKLRYRNKPQPAA